MFQLTAVCFDAEYAYAEAESFKYALEQLLEECQHMADIYPEECAELLVLHPNGVSVTAPMSGFINPRSLQLI